MFVLHETPAGYALFKVNNEAVLRAEDSKEFNELVKNDESQKDNDSKEENMEDSK